MSIVVTELELNQYKKNFQKLSKTLKAKYNTHLITTADSVDPLKNKKLIEFFPPPEKQSPKFIPNISLG